MEYGEAITPEALHRAVELARKRLRDDTLSIAAVASEAVSQTFCVCVVDGEDAAEGRVSDVHKRLIEAVVGRLESSPAPGEYANEEVQPWH